MIHLVVIKQFIFLEQADLILSDLFVQIESFAERIIGSVLVLIEELGVHQTVKQNLTILLVLEHLVRRFEVINHVVAILVMRETRVQALGGESIAMVEVHRFAKHLD